MRGGAVCRARLNGLTSAAIGRVVDLRIGLQQRAGDRNANRAAEIAHQAIDAGGLGTDRRWQRRKGDDIDRDSQEPDAEPLDEADE